MSKTSQQLVGSSHLYLATQIARYTQLLTISLRADLWHIYDIVLAVLDTLDHVYNKYVS